jgi:ESCRT-I complex subunit TSG101
MPQPAGNSYLPYPSQQPSQPSNFPPYPTGNNFGVFPGYPPAQSNAGGAYPPYNMPATNYQPMSGYNANYVS